MEGDIIGGIRVKKVGMNSNVFVRDDSCCIVFQSKISILLVITSSPPMASN